MMLANWPKQWSSCVARDEIGGGLSGLKPGYVIAAGTQVVLKVTKHLPDDDGFKKAGSVGVVARCPDAVDGPYLLEFTDGRTIEACYGTQQKLLANEEPKRAKTVLYAYRVLLTGIHLLRTGEVEASLPLLNERFGLPGIDELVASKTEERVAPAALEWPFHQRQLAELERRLDEAFAESALPLERDRRAVHDLLVRLRLQDRREAAIEPRRGTGDDR